MQRLTLCVIAKNEEAMLAECLASVRGLVDAIVVVDTGSTDRTVEIARAAGATLVHHAWNDDFAAARNAALAQVKSGFILVLDADERLGPGAKSEIRRALKRAEFDCGLLPLHDASTLDAAFTDVVAGRARRGDPVLLPRLLRVSEDLRWEGCVHEQVTEWVLRGRRIATIQAPIVHFGAVPALRESRAKNERNLRLLERRAATEPTNPTVRAYLARELERSGQVDRALDEAERCWSLISESARIQRPTCDVVLPATLLAFLALRAERPERALQVLSSAANWTAPHPNLDLLEGWAHEQCALRATQVEEFARALRAAGACFERALAQRGTLFAAEKLPGATGYVTLSRLGTVQLLAGDIADAEASFRAALAEKPEHVEARLGLVEALLDAQRASDALRELQLALTLEAPDPWLLAASCASALGHDADALLFLNRCVEFSKSTRWCGAHRRGRHAELEAALRQSVPTKAPIAVKPYARSAPVDRPTLTVSVVIPAYNRLDLLATVLTAFEREAQHADFELIVVDDGSVPPVSSLFAARTQPPYLKLIARTANGGRGAALNTGLAAATGEIVIFCDSDIAPGPGFIAEHAAFHEARNDELATCLGALDWGVDAGLYGALVGARGNPRLQGALDNVDWTQWFTDNWSFRRTLLTSRALRFDENYRAWGWEELALAAELKACGATNTLIDGARGAHLKAAAPEDVVRNFARSVPNLLRLAAAHPDDSNVREWLDMRCASHATLERVLAAWSTLWESLCALNVRTGGALRSTQAPCAMALGTTLSDLLFRCGLVRGMLDDDASTCAPPRTTAWNAESELLLSVGPLIAALQAADKALSDGTVSAGLVERTAQVMSLSTDQRKALTERVAACARNLRPAIAA